MQSGFTRHFQIFDAIIACNNNRGFIQFLIKTEQVGFLRGVNSGFVDVERY